jgi:hypothetical protein
MIRSESSRRTRAPAVLPFTVVRSHLVECTVALTPSFAVFSKNCRDFLTRAWREGARKTRVLIVI